MSNSKRMIAGALVALGAAVAPPAHAQEVGFNKGQHLKDIELPTIYGERTVRLSDFRGKKLLLIQFASW